MSPILMILREIISRLDLKYMSMVCWKLAEKWRGLISGELGSIGSLEVLFDKRLIVQPINYLAY